MWLLPMLPLPCLVALSPLMLPIPCRSLMPPVPCPAAAGDGAKRQAVCSLLCELFLADAIPETVIFDCLEQLLWDVSVCLLGGCLAAWWGGLQGMCIAMHAGLLCTSERQRRSA